MSELTIVNVQTLKSHYNNFVSEQDNFNSSSYATFINSYIPSCTDSIIAKMSDNLRGKYKNIKIAYEKIDEWWCSYLENLEGMENSLSNDGRSGSISESLLRNFVSELEELQKYEPDFLEFQLKNVSAFAYTIEQMKQVHQNIISSFDTKEIWNRILDFMKSNNGFVENIIGKVMGGIIFTKNDAINLLNNNNLLDILPDDIDKVCFSNNNESLIIMLKNGNYYTFDNETRELISFTTVDGGIYFIDQFGNVIGSSATNHPDIFNEDNNLSSQFGANQMVFENNTTELLQDAKMIEIIHQYFPEATEEEMGSLFNSLTDVGCGYMALTDALFEYFEGKEEEFLNTFGIPMYSIDKNGDIDFNFEYIALEIFCFKHKDVQDYNGNYSLIEMAINFPLGANEASGYDFFVEYLSEKGIDVMVTQEFYITEEAYQKYGSDNWYSQKEYLDNLRKYLDDPKIYPFIGVGVITEHEDYEWKLYEMNSDMPTYVKPSTANHAMYPISITDTDIIVSSWGREYRLECPKDLLSKITVVKFSKD